MVGSKATHLVERAAERLLQAGVLETSAAHLLEHDRRPPPAPTPPPLSLPAPAEAAPPTHESVPAPAPKAEVVEPDDRPIIDMAALENAGLFEWGKGRSRISEEFRLAQRQVLRVAFAPSAEAGHSNLLMITSARPGEGKSFTSLNLACSVALQGDNRVLLIDGDSKRESLCHALGVADAPGILDLAADPTMDPAKVIMRTAIDHLLFLPVGRERTRSPELFASREMTRLIQTLGKRYADRLLVLDAPPCLSTSDPASLAPVVGQVVFVVEAERTQSGEVEASLDLLQACPTVMLLLNKMQAASRYTFGAYSNYYTS
jgi:protein-tyrosine kinase